MSAEADIYPLQAQAADRIDGAIGEGLAVSADLRLRAGA